MQILRGLIPFTNEGNSLRPLISAVLFLVSLSAFAQREHANVLVTVIDEQTMAGPAWKRETCERVHLAAQQVLERGADVTCREGRPFNSYDRNPQASSTLYDFHLALTRTRRGEIEMDAAHWNRKSDSDFKTLAWAFKNGKTEKGATREEAMARALLNFFFYIKHEEAYKAALLIHGVAESKSISYDLERKTFVERDTNRPLSVDAAMERFEEEGEPQRRYLRAGIEIGVLLSAGLAIYYKNLVYNSVDFDYGFKDGLYKKLISGEAWLMDDNDKFANYGHVYAGVLYYQIARANGFSAFESFLVTTAASGMWELLEYREVFSVNDQIMTPIGGYVVGEAFYQIACSLVTKDSTLARAVGYTINPGLGAAHLQDHFFRSNRFAAQPDCKKPRWSQIGVFLGTDQHTKPYGDIPRSQYLAGMEAEVVTLPGYGEAGRESKLVYDTAMVKALIEANGNEGLIDLRVVAQVVMAAYHKRDRRVNERGQLEGYDLVLGIGSASTWNDRGGERDEKLDDFYGTINVIGATAHANIHYRGFNIRADFAVYGDFVMVKSYALEQLIQARGGVDDQAGSVRRHGYYWGKGASTLAALSVERGRWRVGYDMQASTASSIDSGHRIDPTSPVRFEDTFVVQRVHVTFRLTKNMSVQLAQEVNHRRGNADGRERSGTEHRTLGKLIYQF